MPDPTSVSPSPSSTGRYAVQGDVLHLRADPGWTPEPAAAVEFLADGWLLVENGKVAGLRAADAPPDAGWDRVDWRGHLILPGFLDTHVHSPQLDVIASYGTALLDWLETYTFPAEAAYADPAAAEAGADRFLHALLANGVTAAVVFPTVHKVATDALFARAQALGMRLIAGKVLMDRHCPPDLADPSVAAAERDSVELIERWHGVDRLAYAITPRFAPTSTEEQLALSGELLRAYAGRAGGLYMQTHVAENPSEVKWVGELFPEARSYLDVYARYGLLGRRSVLAHGIWLDAHDRGVLAEAGGQIASCPSSNMFLGSGLFPWTETEAAGIAVSLASDVGGGTSLSPLRTLADAYKVLALRGERLTAWKALHAATLGAARALELDGEVGHFGSGTIADFAVWRWAEGPVQARRQEMARNLHERVFAWMTLGDAHNLVATYVQGRQLYAAA